MLLVLLLLLLLVEELLLLEGEVLLLLLVVVLLEGDWVVLECWSRWGRLYGWACLHACRDDLEGGLGR